MLTNKEIQCLEKNILIFYNGKPELGNIRFLTDEIIKKRGQEWRVNLLFERK